MIVGNISVAKRMIENPRSWLVDWKFDRGSEVEWVGALLRFYLELRVIASLKLMPREMDCDFSRIKEIGVSSRLSVVKFNCLNERLIL